MPEVKLDAADAAERGAGTQGDPELARADLLRRERAGLPAAVQDEPEGREPVAVLADCLDRKRGEDSATEYQRKSLVRADDLALLHARWADQIQTADRERYHRIVHEALPEEWRGKLSPQATWLYRTMKAAELAGLDAAEVTQTAIRSRSLDGTRDVASVVDARLRAMVEPLVPLPLSRWSERVPEIANPERHEYVRRLAEAMDERKERIGEHAVHVQPEWALRAFGPVPEDPGERLDWQQRASVIGAYRELYGVEDLADAIGPEPAGSSPEQRAAWHAGFAALTRTDTVDVRALPEASLWHMRDSYKAETQWAPPHTGRQLRGVRLAAENARQLAIRSQAEAQATTDPDTAARHARVAASAEALEDAYRPIEASLAEAMDDRRAWEHITSGSRRLAVAADSELRRRCPDRQIEPLRSAEPRARTRRDHQANRCGQAGGVARMDHQTWRAPAGVPGEACRAAERHGPGRGSRLWVFGPGMARAGTRPRRHPAAAQAGATAPVRNRTAHRARAARQGSRRLRRQQWTSTRGTH
jgi:hypothetical protein